MGILLWQHADDVIFGLGLGLDVMFCGCHAHCGTQKNNVYGNLVEGILISEAEEEKEFWIVNWNEFKACHMKSP